jgi:hypothetical protein
MVPAGVSRFPMTLRRTLLPWLIALGAVTATSARFVELGFDVPFRRDIDPWAREISAQVRRPDGATVRPAAFYDEGDRWAVRVRADTVGEYRLGTVVERRPDGLVALLVRPENGGVARARAAADPRGAIGIDPANPRQFAHADGTPYVPVGLNLAWGPEAFHATAFARMAEHGLNWTRVWLAHWGGLNPDWREGQPALPLGELDLAVLRRWEALLADAESHGVRVQVVLQHHGQWSTQVNPNWRSNPWNAANRGGFLEDPAAFFTDERARALTRRKYRHLVARLGHSDAVLAWELFNEVQFTDAYRVRRDEAAVAAWHAEMAAWIREHDAHGRLITTSFDRLDSPIYAAMDYFQPHLYGVNMLAAARRFAPSPGELGKPVFYGEVGDERMLHVPEALRQAGHALIPHLWAGTMSAAAAPPQPWFWQRILDTPLFDELGTLARFVAAADLARHGPWTAFEPPVQADRHVPRRLLPAYYWDERPPAQVELPDDGREPAALAELPHFLVGPGRDAADRLAFRASWAEEAPVVVHFSHGGDDGTRTVLLLDDQPIGEAVWDAVPEDRRPSPARPHELHAIVPAGTHTLTLVNEGPDSSRLAVIETGLEAPVLAAVGRRSPTRVLLYVWHRDNVHAPGTSPAANGTVTVENLPAGRWTVTWWEPATGPTGEPRSRDHAGGDWALETPSVARHAAALLVRSE